ncbi:glutathione S-transferase family protein [Porphyrobacter sp. YT40]|uniref:glutathione S-transferase family protein n=1 Tax=Porphyrobacter sp. YT40 TaxID=2547601 RepID=UPI001141E531|nr:glutathione S-transferase family protein [Porphyrobacter sp. YT40]QDH32951.1 glutathione S-transferase family protein [Porphyrobacter sp. YT40]
MSDTRPDLVIYGSPVSPFVRKVAALCSEKGVAFETENVDIFNPPPWFRDISPMKRIPVLRDRSIAEEGAAGTIADSSAICAYIEKKHPAPAFYPAEAYAHGRAIFIEEFADTSVAMAGGMGIFRPIFFSILQGKEPDLEKARKSWAEDMPPLLAWLDGAIGESGFFAGDALSIADIAVACVLAQVALVAEMPLGAYPALSAHYDRISARPSLAGPFAKAEAFVRKALPTPFDLT